MKKEKPILDILNGKKPERCPLWLMRQAGRYLPEYKKIRAQAGNFLDLCLTPELAAEITLQPVRRFGFDAAILFADILLVPYALGQGLKFREGEGPVLEPVENDKMLEQLNFKSAVLAPVYETIHTVKKQLPEPVSLIGFCGGLWTVAAYMIDGTSRQDFAAAQNWAVEQPERLERLINTLLDASEHYLCNQIEAGAEILQIFESWAGLLKGSSFERWIIKPTQELIARIKNKHPHIPIIGFPRGAGAHYPAYARETGIDTLGIDQQVSLDYARTQLKPLKLLQGNLDPLLLIKGGEEMRLAAVDILENLGPNHIFNLGHGILPETPLEHVSELTDIVHNFKAAG